MKDDIIFAGSMCSLAEDPKCYMHRVENHFEEHQENLPCGYQAVEQQKSRGLFSTAKNIDRINFLEIYCKGLNDFKSVACQCSKPLKGKNSEDNGECNFDEFVAKYLQSHKKSGLKD